MTVKSSIRFLIGYIIAAVLMGIGLPFAGIPHAQLLPPPVVYGNAKGTAVGYVIKKHMDPTGNPFHVGDNDYMVDYAFRAKPPHILGANNTPDADGMKRYYGLINASQEAYGPLLVGQTVPVKYETTYPDINGIDQPGFGRSGSPGSTIFSGWLIWFVVACVLGYLIAPFLERIMLRESY